MRIRFILATTGALAALLLVIAGCGGGSSSNEPASLAPPGSLVFVEGTLRPSGALKSNVDAIAEDIVGIENLGDYIVEQLESSARDDGEPFDFATEVEPWLGETAGLFFESLSDGDLSNGAMAIQSTDTDATQEFVDKQTSSGEDSFEDAAYEGVDYRVDRADDTAIAVIGDFLVVGEEAGLKKAVDASSGDSLAGEAAYEDAIEGAAEGSLADVYVDVGLLIEQSGDEIDAGALQALRSLGIDPREATAVASVVPGADEVEIALSSDLGDQEAPSGDASELLGSLPADSFVAFAASGFGEQLQEALDSLDSKGVPGTIPPNQLKKGVKELGINLEGLVDSLRDAAVFATGNSERSLGGALVLTAEGSKATEAVEQAVTLVRRFNVGGVTLLGGKTSGFAVHSSELGPKPLVVAARDGRVAVGYGVPPTLRGLAASAGKTLADNPAYEEAVAALGSTPISGFVDGRSALRLADALVPSSETGFQEAKQYLRQIAFVAVGTGTEGDLATAKLIVGLEK